MSGVTSVKLPAGLKGIGARAFIKTDITEITIPASVSYIGDYAFAACKDLVSINVEPESDYFKSIDGVLYSKDGSELIWCPKRESADFIIPDGVKTVKSGAFTYSNVEKITVLDPETEFEKYSAGYRGYINEDAGGVFNWIQESLTYVNIVCLEGSKAEKYGEDNFVKITTVNGDPTGCTHENFKLITVEATCTETGRIDARCEECGMLLETHIIPARGHSYESVTVEPSYREKGHTLHTCSVCKDSYSDSYTEYREPVVFDTNGDGAINVKDSNYMKRIIIGSIIPNDKEFFAADVNGDGLINTKDAFEIKRRFIAG